ncbi:hypothetical protein TrLO_g5590 [Triparma laevis f. longispina]|uniref:Uncharacterized protein n=1 Tax=Triparma laevis f. longispina TaxID=1714387 RepID=A0A9W7AGN2_9STRA|nr:hypothetical protein TrLO_g5590 [Triparma laevis f. longispina]
MRITIDESDILSLMNGYLISAGFHHTSYILEQETKHTNYLYGRDITFARSLILSGRWLDLKKFLTPMKRSNFDYDRSLFLVEKQIFLEMLNAQTNPTSVEEGNETSSEMLVSQLKVLEGKCSLEEFHGLCFCLTVKSLSNHPEYKSWTVYGGRFELFDSMLKHLQSVFPDQVERRGRAKDMPDNHLVKICQLAVMQQIQEHKYHNPNARIPEEFFASVLGEVFTYKKNVSDGGIPQGEFGVSQSVPNGKGMCEWILDPVEERKTKVNDSNVTTGLDRSLTDDDKRNSAVPPVLGKVVEEAQGFFSLEGKEEEVNERFDPPMEVTHFPPAEVEKRPPQAWEIKWNEDGEDDSSQEEKEKDRKQFEEAKKSQIEEQEQAEKEKEALENPLAYPAMNPEDPYGHVTAEDSFLRFKCLATLQESHPIRTVAFAPTGSVFCVGTNSKALRLCQFNEEEQTIEVLHERASHHSGSVYSASWNSDSRLIATGSNDKTVKVIRVFLEDQDDGYGMVSNSLESNDLVLKGHGGTVRDVSFHNEDNGRLLSVGAHDNLGLVWDIVGVGGAEIAPVRKLEGHEQTVYCGKFSPFETHFVATGSADNTVKLWDLRSNTSTGSTLTIKATSPILSVVFLSKYSIMSSHADGTLRQVDIKTGKTVSVIQAHNDECRSLDTTLCKRYLLSGGFDGSASVFSTLHNPVPEFKASMRTKAGGRILNAKFRPRGGLGMLMAGADCTVQYWGPSPS